jgi:glutathione S-transferase
VSGLVVYTFSPDWGLPTGGPFALKLIKWLEIAGLPFEQRIENNPARGPKGKNPWIELDGDRIGDSEVIIEILAKRSGFDIDAGLSPEQRALSHAVRRMLEEHFHQVFEWELFVHPNGAAWVQGVAESIVPKPLAGLAASAFSGRLRRQLHARGIARHSDDVIAGKGRADVEAFEVLLGNGPYLTGERPCMADVSAYGLLAPMAHWPMRTPVADYVKSRPVLLAYLERVGPLRAEQRIADQPALLHRRGDEAREQRVRLEGRTSARGGYCTPMNQGWSDALDRLGQHAVGRHAGESRPLASSPSR